MTLLGTYTSYVCIHYIKARGVNHIKVLCTEMKAFPDLLALVQSCMICVHSLYFFSFVTHRILICAIQ